MLLKIFLNFFPTNKFFSLSFPFFQFRKYFSAFNFIRVRELIILFPFWTIVRFNLLSARTLDLLRKFCIYPSVHFTLHPKMFLFLAISICNAHM